MLQRLFERLGFFISFAATPAEWFSNLGGNCFTFLPEGYFSLSGRVASSIPCQHQTRNCRRNHWIEEDAEGESLIACPDPEAGCRPFAVRHEDRLVWQMDLPSVFGDIAETLGCVPSVEKISASLWRVGHVTKKDIPVYVSCAEDQAGHIDNLSLAALTRPEDFVILITDAGSSYRAVEAAAKTASGRFGILGDFLKLDSKRRLLIADLELADRWPELSRDPARPARKLRLPDGADWKHLVVTLLDNGHIAISHRTGSPNDTYTQRELGFESRHGKESLDWVAFQTAAHVGYIPESAIGSERDEDTRSRVKGITKKLAAVTGIKGTAFALSDGPEHGLRPRGAGRGYWPLFKFRTQSDRVRRGAARLGNSPSDPDDFPDERN